MVFYIHLSIQLVCPSTEHLQKRDFTLKYLAHKNIRLHHFVSDFKTKQYFSFPEIVFALAIAIEGILSSLYCNFLYNMSAWLLLSYHLC